MRRKLDIHVDCASSSLSRNLNTRGLLNSNGSSKGHVSFAIASELIEEMDKKRSEENTEEL